MASVTNCFPPDLAALGRRRQLPTATDGHAIKPITSNNKPQPQMAKQKKPITLNIKKQITNHSYRWPRNKTKNNK